MKEASLRDLDRYNSWLMLSLDSVHKITFLNDKMKKEYPDIQIGQGIKEAFDWFQEEWFTSPSSSRVVKINQFEKMLLEILPSEKSNGELYFFLRNVTEFRNVTHLWCEVEDSMIRLQPFIDNSHDGIIITNGDGIVRAINQTFVLMSGLTEDDVLGKSVYELSKNGYFPMCSMMKALESNRLESSVVKFSKGKETVVSSKPLCDKRGHIIRVLSNVRDITELRELHEKLNSAESRAKHYQKEYNAKIISESSLNLELCRSRVMEDVYELVKKVADTDLPLLLLGESGIGKTALAKSIHTISERKNTGSFVHINCSAIPESLLESELFGYEAGAFTGAQKTKAGLFEIAQKGTILLDEIGDMPMALQAKLLNVLQEKKFYRVGGTKTLDVDVRVLAATNQDLEKLIQLGKFRRDLYFRINVIPITLPSLKERPEDITPMLAHFLKQSNEIHHKNKVLSPEAVGIMLKYSWPGNIRELINVVERLVVLTQEDIINPSHLPLHFMNSRDEAPLENMEPCENRVFLQPGNSLKEVMRNLEKQVIKEAVRYYGSVKKAAENLGVNESTLTRKRSKFINK